MESCPPLQEQGLILVADDDRIIRHVMRMALEQLGYRVEDVTNGHDCLKAYQDLQPDLVLLDIKMPDIDGFECCRRLKALPQSSHVPILMITGLEDATSVDKAFAVGASDYVTKPIHWPVLKQRVRVFLRQTRLQKELEASNARLQVLASIDDLTQLSNHRVFKEYLHQVWQQLAPGQQPLTLVLADVDFFKKYNDAYGHPAGDQCLYRVASVIKQAVCRPGDLVARYGGEEFAVILPDTALEGGVQIGQRIQQALRDEQIVHASSEISEWVTLSLGLASMVPHLEEQAGADQLVMAADQALYQAKTAGRNRIIQAHPQSAGLF